MRFRLSFLLLFSVVINIYGQSLNWPFTWFELEISKKLNKNLKMQFNPELRYFENFKLDSYILEGGLSYKVNKYLSFGSLYRFENEYKAKKDKFKPSHRGEFDAVTGFLINRFDMKLRIRYVNDLGIEPENNNNASYFRYRLKLEYDINSSKIKPYISVEIYHDLIFKQIDKIKYTAGLSYPMKKLCEFTLFYRFQQKPPNASADHILGIGFGLKL